MTDRAVREAVIDALSFDPSIDASRIGVAVDAGIATLDGHVASHAARAAAARIARSVRGVRGIVDRMNVRLATPRPLRDADLARQAAQLLAWNVMLPRDAIKVKATEGWITLTGSVSWRYQKSEAQGALARMPGLRGLINLIEVAPTVGAVDLRGEIEAALRRDTLVDADSIAVSVYGDEVVLTGTVRGWSERAAAERTAWSATGIRSVHNRIDLA